MSNLVKKFWLIEPLVSPFCEVLKREYFSYDVEDDGDFFLISVAQCDYLAVRKLKRIQGQLEATHAIKLLLKEHGVFEKFPGLSLSLSTHLM